MSWVTEISEVDPEPGDLIEISRAGYEHWAIYIGDGDVVHLAPESDAPGSSVASLASSATARAMVKKERLWKVVAENEFRINNKYDRRYTPRPVDEVISRAKEMVGRARRYNVFRKNCEHFVTDLRYGIAVSDQVTEAVDGAANAVAGAVDPDEIASGVTNVGVSIVASGLSAIGELFGWR